MTALSEQNAQQAMVLQDAANRVMVVEYKPAIPPLFENVSK